ncbi:MAG: DUF3078 domain-containing protein [Bacteroidota bacterium]|nr:DUF3078 domain-containing protein [Bacteroidota bacterium]MDP4229188.1 DUF3078 domain-containing protein [Bacteroidota bacterium]MDP4236708.1 DUF3078 domain-containing protein [Bacteroidota bacterium]
MKKYVVAAILFVAIAIPLDGFAQQKADDKDTIKHGWTHSLISTLNLSQVSYTNWAAGGANALAYNLLIDGRSIDEQVNTNWTTNYKFSYGQARLANLGLRKTDDKIDLESILAYKMSEHYDPYASVTFKSQFTTSFVYDDVAGTKTAVSGFLDPAIATEAVGMSYRHAASFQTRLGVALRETFTNHYNVYTDDPSTPQIEKSKIEGGLESVTQVELALDDNILFKSKLELFAPFKTMDVITVRSDNVLAMKVNKYIVSSLGVQLINDRVVTPRTQIKEVLALGLTYAIF